MQQSGEKMEKLIYARDGKELYKVVVVRKQRKGRPFSWAKLSARVLPQEPPPAPGVNYGHIP